MIKNTEWMTYAEYLSIELLQSEEEGKNIDKYRKKAEQIQNLEKESMIFEKKERMAYELLGEIEKEPVEKGYRYYEPNEWEEIQKACDENHNIIYEIPKENIKDSIYGAWMGRCIGCLLGQPVEGWKRERILGFLKDTDNYPINRFMSSAVEENIIEKYQVSNNGAFCDTVTHWINNVKDMPEDDDTNYTTIGLKVLETYGKEFTSDDMAEMWITSLPMGHVSTSERVAYRNIGNLIEPPRSGWWKNPYREWIGAQIRGDIFGYVSPGKPTEAAYMAWKDGRISHVKNGIYGEMYVASILAAAFGEKNVEKLVEIGLGQIPQKSRLYEEIDKILTDYRKGETWQQETEWLHQRHDEGNSHQWCHTLTNAAVVTMCLLYSDGDFEKAIGHSVEIGFDTDCNGATVGSIMGLLYGYQALPLKWREGITGNLRTGVSGFYQMSVKELAERTWKLV